MPIAIASEPARAGGRSGFTGITGALFNRRTVGAQARALCLTVVAVSMAGCIGFPTSGEPSRDVLVEDVLPPLIRPDGTPTISALTLHAYQAALQNPAVRLPGAAGKPARDQAVYLRNEFISETMAAIDMAYTIYETRLTNQVEEASFGAKILSTGLSGAVPLVPVTATKDILGAASSWVSGTDAAFSEKILVTKTVQNVQTQMRNDRAGQRTVILANMRCSIGTYPLGLALSDLELYRRYGTFASGLIGVTNTVNVQADKSKAALASATPGTAGVNTEPAASQTPTPAELAATAVASGRGCLGDQKKKTVPGT